MPKELLHKDESYFIIGLCMEVHNELGIGFSEIVYGDALELELKSNGAPYKREIKFEINYKGTKLPHHYYADFLLDDKTILEIKAIQSLTTSHVKQTLNYLAVSKLKLGLLVNFGEDGLTYKRVVL